MAYEPGPYAPSEFMLNDFTDWYADRMSEFCEPSPHMRIAAE
jgi:Rieske 2Fe-2S family protein